MKNRVYKTMAISICLSAMLFANGCVSYMVMKNSEKEVATRRAMAAGDEGAIRAINLGEGAAGIGFDVSNLDALGEHPWLQLGAAVIDAALMVGTYEGIKSFDDDGPSPDPDPEKSIEVNTTGDGNSVDIVIINGNDNDSNADDGVVE